MHTEQHNWLGPYLGGGDWVHQLAQQIKLFYYLMRDRRVHWLAKTIPLATIIYLVSPVDWLQNAIPVLGQLGDVAVVALGFRLFLEFSPREVVHEHLLRLAGVSQGSNEWDVVSESPTSPASTAPDIIEGTYREER